MERKHKIFYNFLELASPSFESRFPYFLALGPLAIYLFWVSGSFFESEGTVRIKGDSKHKAFSGVPGT